jgi:hypothetical protein
MVSFSETATLSLIQYPIKKPSLPHPEFEPFCERER